MGDVKTRDSCINLASCVDAFALYVSRSVVLMWKALCLF